MGPHWALLARAVRRKDRRGRPWREHRAVLNGILWILRTGAPWADLPDRYPWYQTCHRRFQQWVRGACCVASSKSSLRHSTTKANDVGRSSDSLPGYRTFGGSSCAMSDSPRTFSGCYTSPVAHSVAGFMRWLLESDFALRALVEAGLSWPERSRRQPRLPKRRT